MNIKTVTSSDLRVAPVVRATQATAVTASATGAATGPATPTAQPAPSGIAREMAASPPVETDRVAQIKAAIANGTYPILPETIADRMIAFKLGWSSHDKA